MNRILVVCLVVLVSSVVFAQEPDAKALMTKGKELIKTQELTLAQSTFDKALLACKDDEQLLKADLYLWFAMVREFKKAIDRKPKEAEWYDIESRQHFRSILLKEKKTSQEISAKQKEIQLEYRTLTRKKKDD
jgi:hypothetical protein